MSAASACAHSTSVGSPSTSVREIAPALSAPPRVRANAPSELRTGVLVCAGVGRPTAAADCGRNGVIASNDAQGYLRDGRTGTASGRDEIGAPGALPQRHVVTVASPKVHAIVRHADKPPGSGESDTALPVSQVATLRRSFIRLRTGLIRLLRAHPTTLRQDAHGQRLFQQPASLPPLGTPRSS
jgi:hypothetical protein